MIEAIRKWLLIRKLEKQVVEVDYFLQEQTLAGVRCTADSRGLNIFLDDGTMIIKYEPHMFLITQLKHSQSFCLCDHPEMFEALLTTYMPAIEEYNHGSARARIETNRKRFELFTKALEAPK